MEQGLPVGDTSQAFVPYFRANSSRALQDTLSNQWRCVSNAVTSIDWRSSGESKPIFLRWTMVAVYHFLPPKFTIDPHLMMRPEVIPPGAHHQVRVVCTMLN